MPTYLERYIAGEHEHVWHELLAQGVAVREEPLYTDAWAVAVETMRRAHANIEVLAARLKTHGYTFGYCWAGALERSVARGQAPTFAPPPPNVGEQIAELERLTGPLPLSLRAFYTVVGAVNFVGTAPASWDVDERTDPLYVYPLTQALAEYVDWRQAHGAWQATGRNNPGPFRVPIAPDYLHKYNISGGMWYHIVLPNPAVDVPLGAERHRTTFVNYLRTCFRWAGFPGLEFAGTVPDDDLAALRQGLLPI
jgi:hypothetical protein